MLKKYIPQESVLQINKWIKELRVEVNITKQRKTKLGDFKILRNGQYQISVNNDLNKYAFLITVTHELAHSFVWKKHKYKVKPHGKEWKKTFKHMMLNFLNPKIFPNDILKALSKHLLNPKASSLTDITLAKALSKYDKNPKTTIADIADRTVFIGQNGKSFIKLGKIKKRYKCQDLVTKKIYLFNPMAIVNI